MKTKLILFSFLLYLSAFAVTVSAQLSSLMSGWIGNKSDWTYTKVYVDGMQNQYPVSNWAHLTNQTSPVSITSTLVPETLVPITNGQVRVYATVTVENVPTPVKVKPGIYTTNDWPALSRTRYIYRVQEVVEAYALCRIESWSGSGSDYTDTTNYVSLLTLTNDCTLIKP